MEKEVEVEVEEMVAECSNTLHFQMEDKKKMVVCYSSTFDRCYLQQKLDEQEVWREGQNEACLKLENENEDGR